MDWLSDPTHPKVRAALARCCDICRAEVGARCTNTIQPSVGLPGRRIVHIARLEDR